jgi:aspartate/methionine/tyrosine aminotransferase
LSSGTIDAWPSGDSYSQWLRGAIGRVRGSTRPLHRLFDSSTAEPVELLADLAAKAFAHPITSRYEAVFAGGNPHVMTALAARYGVDRSRILCTPGATSALALLYRTYLGHGDHVLVETPGFDLFEDLAAAQGARVDHFERSGPHATIDVEALAARIRPTTRLIVLSDLHNPTGAALDEATLTAIAALGEARGVDIILDEVYREYAAVPPSGATLSPAVIRINSLTKVYGLSALRCGWIIADDSRIDRIRTVHTRLEFGVSKVSHALAALVLEEPFAFEAHWRGLLKTARPLIEMRMAHWQSEGMLRVAMPEYGCVCFPELVGIADTRAFADWLVDNYGVLVAPGAYFGAPGHVRIGFSSDAPSLEAALDAFGDGLAAFRAQSPLSAVA